MSVMSGHRRQSAWRAFGILLLASGAGALSQAHRIGGSVAWLYSPILAWAVGLTGFALAMTGVLLAVHGAELRQRWRARQLAETATRHPPRRRPPSDAIDPWLVLNGFAGGRLALTSFLIVRAQERGAARRPSPMQDKGGSA
ncbi:hypothetical protein FHS31_002144 [Sphingomonas vulcanisoli]|uniref:Uncharacterized protein n=1 Tax=Sphingomonas vulcanisoli TaxID=1658060 RepID=A0ABX0TTZ4_9SPHN|nr:hypothetical protein [Sphingomonas vulcanisoli]NIJ08523.1 hypothetical protein [Sphingomonas vulcanisoli]